jgi:hypothetical protein
MLQTPGGDVRVPFRDIPTWPELRGRQDPIYNPLDATVVQASELVGGTIFTVDGIIFGLEVCRDHYLGRLRPARNMARCKSNSFRRADGETPHIRVRVHSTTMPQPAQVKTAGHVGGNIRIYQPARIPCQGWYEPTSRSG